MNPLLTIAKFEFRYHLRQPMFYLYALLILAQGIWATYQQVTYATGNPTIDTYYVLSSFGLILAIVTVLLAGQSLTKDAEFRTTSYLQTLPITSRIHFAGRFLGTYITGLLLAACSPLGIVLALITQGTGVDSIPWIALIDGFIRLLSINSFIIISSTVSLTVFLRSVRGAYISLFLVVLYFLLTASNEVTQTNSDIWLLLDPFGVGMTQESINTMSFLADADKLLTFTDMLFINRLIWIGLALGMLAQAEVRFSFDIFTYQQSDKLPLLVELNSYSPSHLLPIVQVRFGGWLPYRTTLHLAKLEFRNLVYQPVFHITTGLLILLAVLLATTFSLNPDFPELPTTSHMTALRIPMGLFISLFLIIMTSELIFYERTVGLWPLYDALPQPNFVLLLAKLIALVGAAGLLTVTLFLIGIGLQLANGFGDIDWHLYTSDLLMDGLWRYCQLMALAALVAILINNRLISHIFNLVVFIGLTTAYQINIPDKVKFLYSFLPGSTAYSDLIGYGSNSAIRPAIHIIWWGFTGLFLTLLILTWNRGLSGGLRERVREWQNRFSWPYGLAIAVSGLIFGVGLWTFQKHYPATETSQMPIQYTTQTTTIKSISGRFIPVQVKYYHPYQVKQILTAAQSAMHKGEQLFGIYPYSSLQILEVPHGPFSVWSKPGQLAISEKQGWTADFQQPKKLDYIDYLVSREVFKQWLVHRIKPIHQPADGFIRQSLAEYLALQEVSEKYGPDRLKQRLTQRRLQYISKRNHNNKPELAVLQSTGNDALERGRGALALSSIGQVWGNAPLSLTIGQFYRQAIQQPTATSASAFVKQLSNRLPDSLRYLTTYLSDQVWFEFKIGRIANLPNGLSVEIVASKWREKVPNHRQPLLINDFIPLAVYDQEGREIYRMLVHPNPDEQFARLPALPMAKAVLIDPAGTWPELNKRDNYKIF